MINYKKLGETISLPNMGDIITYPDGSEWKSNIGILYPYSSKYSDLLATFPNMVTSAEHIPGPTAGYFSQTLPITEIIGPSSGIWVAISGSNILTYFTSIDQGVTWIERSLPTTTTSYTVGLYDGTNYILVSSTGTIIIESTDGINWTQRVGVSITPRKLIYEGGLYILVSTTTTYATSTDRITWTSRVRTGGMPASIYHGIISYNSGAGLYIMGDTSSSRKYITSPDGINWTQRTGKYTFDSTNGGFASNGTTTIHVSRYGFVHYSIDLINWTTVTLLDGEGSTLGTPVYINYDGTHFIVYINSNYVFYSSDGINWTRTRNASLGNISSSSFLSLKYGICSTSLGYIYRISDITSAVHNNIITLSNASVSVTGNYICIYEGTNKPSPLGLTTEEHDKLLAIPENPFLTTDTRLDHIDADISSRMATFTYTAPDNTGISDIKAKTDQLIFTTGNLNAIAKVVEDKTGYTLTPTERSDIATAVEIAILNEGDGQAILEAIVAAIGNTNLDQISLVAAIRADIERNGGLLDTKPSLTDIESSTVLAKETSVQKSIALSA